MRVNTRAVTDCEKRHRKGDGRNVLKVQASEVPIPPELVSLPTIKAEPWLLVDPSPDIALEGPAFDRKGNLYITSYRAGMVYKITPTKQKTIVFTDKNVRPDGIAIHKDGRLFTACTTGELLVMNPDGGKVTYITPKYQDKSISMNDLVFDSKGNLYVTDWKGTVPDPTGGVYRLLAPDYTAVQPVLQHLAGPNGISLSPEGNTLWIGETLRNAVLRIDLMPDGLTVKPVAGVTYPYYSTGGPGGPDSNKVDIEGNLYQCMVYQGRALILNKRGIPIANVVIPGRDEGKHLGSPNLAFKPGTSEVYIEGSGEGGAMIFKFKGLAKGLPLFSHQ